MKFSIVIPTYNRANLVKECIDSIYSYGFGNNFELIVINDGSNDNTAEVLSSVNRDGFKFFSIQNSGKSKARNRGIKESSGDVIVFIDDDCVVDKDWFNQIKKSFHDNSVKGVIGSSYYIDKENRGFFPERIVENKEAFWPITLNIAYRKEVFERIGFFDSRFDDYFNEDTEFAYRYLNAGYQFDRNKNAIVYHQKSFWNIKSLPDSARSHSVWPILKKRYPDIFKNSKLVPPNIMGIVIFPKDYLFLLLLPLVLPISFLKLLFKGSLRFDLVFIKWAILPLVRRFFLIRESVRHKVIMF